MRGRKFVRDRWNKFYGSPGVKDTMTCGQGFSCQSSANNKLRFAQRCPREYLPHILHQNNSRNFVRIVMEKTETDRYSSSGIPESYLNFTGLRVFFSFLRHKINLRFYMYDNGARFIYAKIRDSYPGTEIVSRKPVRHLAHNIKK